MNTQKINSWLIEEAKKDAKEMARRKATRLDHAPVLEELPAELPMPSVFYTQHDMSWMISYNKDTPLRTILTAFRNMHGEFHPMYRFARQGTVSISTFRNERYPENDTYPRCDDAVRTFAHTGPGFSSLSVQFTPRTKHRIVIHCNYDRGRQFMGHKYIKDTGMIHIAPPQVKSHKDTGVIHIAPPQVKSHAKFSANFSGGGDLSTIFVLVFPHEKFIELLGEDK